MLLGMVGCTDPDEGAGDSVEAAITVEPTTITTTLDGDVKELTVTSNAAWVVSCDQEDVTIEPKTGRNNGVVTVTIPAVTAARNFSIQFKASKPAMMQGIPYTSEAEAAVAVYQNAGGDTSIATNVKEVRALLKALEVTETKTDITDELKAMTLTGIVVAEPNGNMSNDYTINVQDDSTEANSGLTVYSVENAKQLKKGDVVKFSLETAQYQYYKGLLQLVAGASAEVVTEGVEVNPIEVAFADLKNYEAQYVKVNGLTPAKAAVGKAWNSTTGGVNVNFTTADNKTLIVRVNKAASFKNDIVPAKSGALCGVISIFNSDVQLMPQYASDIQLTEDAAGLEAQVVTIAEITQAGTYKVENAWVAGFNGNGPIFTDASGAYINSYIYQHNYKTIGQKVTIEGDVTIRQGGFQFEGPTVTPLDGAVEVVYPENPTVYEGEAVVALCEKFLSGAHLAEYAAFKGVLEYDGTYYNLVFAGIDGNKYKGSLSKTPDESLGLDKLNGVPVTLYGFVVDYSGQYVSIVPTSVVENKDAVVLAADAITNVPKEGVTNATHDITVIGIDAVTTEVDGTVVTAASVAGNVLTYSVSANTDKSREGWIKLSAEGVETVTVVVKQSSALAYNFKSDAPFVDSSQNYNANAKVNGSADVNASGFKIGTGDVAGYFASQPVSVEGDLTLEFYAVAWKGKSATLYVRKQGSTELLGQFTLKANDGASNQSPYTLTLNDDNYYSVNVSGVTANTVLEFAADASFSKVANKTSGRAIVVGVHLLGGTPSTPDTPDTPDTPVTPTVKTLPYAESFATSQGDFTINDVNLGGLNGYVWSWASAQYGMKASAYVEGTRYATESWLVSPEISLANATAPELTFSHVANHTNGTAAEVLTLWVKESGATEWISLAIPQHGTDSWTFVESGAIDLAAYNNKTIQIGFKYTSTTEVAPTWEVKNFKVAEKGATIEPEPEPVITETISGLSHIENLDGVTAGKYYFAAYSTKNSSEEVFTKFPYHLWTGTVTSGKADTANYAFADGVLSRDPKHTSTAPETEVAVEAELVAVEGKTNVYYIKFNNSYLSVSGYTANHKLVMSETALEWTAVEHTDGVVFQATDGTNSVTLCTGTAANDLLRQYKTPSFDNSISTNQPYNGVHLFKKN